MYIKLFYILLFTCLNGCADIYIDSTLEPYVVDTYKVLEQSCGYLPSMPISYKFASFEGLKSGEYRYTKGIEYKRTIYVDVDFFNRNKDNHAITYLLIHEIAHAHSIKHIDNHILMDTTTNYTLLRYIDPLTLESIKELCITMKQKDFINRNPVGVF